MHDTARDSQMLTAGSILATDATLMTRKMGALGRRGEQEGGGRGLGGPALQSGRTTTSLEVKQRCTELARSGNTVRYRV